MGKKHLAAEYANKDKILETNVTFTIHGQKSLVAGRDPITITAFDPRFEEEAKSGCCCFGRPGVKRGKVTVIKKFLTAPLHISSGDNGVLPPSATSYPSFLPPSVGNYYPQQKASAPPMNPSGQYVSPQVTAGYPSEVQEYATPMSGYPPAPALGNPPAAQHPAPSQLSSALQYPTTLQHSQPAQYPAASHFPTSASSENNQDWAFPSPYSKQ